MLLLDSQSTAWFFSSSRHLIGSSSDFGTLTIFLGGFPNSALSVQKAFGLVGKVDERSLPAIRPETSPGADVNYLNKEPAECLFFVYAPTSYGKVP